MKLSHQAQVLLRISCLAGVALAAAVSAWGNQLPGLPNLTAQPAASSTTGASSQTNAPAATDASQPQPEPDVGKQLEQIDERLRVAKRSIEHAQDETPEAKAPPEQLRRKEELLNKKKSIIQQIEASQQRFKDLTASQEDLQAQLEALHASEEEYQAGHTFHELEQVRDELVAEQAVEASQAVAVDTAVKTRDSAQTELEEKQRQRRQAKDALASNNDPAKTAKLSNALELANLEVEVATEQLKLRGQELKNEKFAQQVHEIRLTYLREKESYLKEHVSFSIKERDEFQTALKIVEKGRQSDREEAAHQRLQYDNLQAEARAKLDGDEHQREITNAEIEAWKTASKVQQQRMDTLDRRLERLESLEKTWDHRYHVFNGQANAEQLEQWKAEAQKALDGLTQDEILQQAQVKELNHQRASLKPAIAAAREKNPEIARWLQRQEEALRDLDEVYDANMEGIQLSRRVYERLIAEIEEQEHTLPIWETFRQVLGKVSAIWRHVLISIEGEPITVGDIVTGIILLLIGFLLSRIISRWLGRRVFPRLGLHTSAAAALQSIVFYLLVAFFTLYALRFVQVPLTVFTFLGGALAIGVGFGSQNIVNNFISGLILLAERPIRIGDVVQIDGLYGTIENIGARSTRVRTATNMEIIVPNSSFLQNNVVNWTLSDHNIRAQIDVGVMYGSPTRDVSKLLRRAAEDHGLVLGSPEPFVWFSSFGDNALQFELHFWIEMRNLSEKRRVESDVRFRIDQLFAEAGIVIAYPQRDVHLNGTGPLEVRLLRSNGREEQDATSPNRSAA